MGRGHCRRGSIGMTLNLCWCGHFWTKTSSLICCILGTGCGWRNRYGSRLKLFCDFRLSDRPHILSDGPHVLSDGPHVLSDRPHVLSCVMKKWNKFPQEFSVPQCDAP